MASENIPCATRYEILQIADISKDIYNQQPELLNKESACLEIPVSALHPSRVDKARQDRRVLFHAGAVPSCLLSHTSLP